MQEAVEECSLCGEQVVQSVKTFHFCSFQSFACPLRSLGCTAEVCSKDTHQPVMNQNVDVLTTRFYLLKLLSTCKKMW